MSKSLIYVLNTDAVQVGANGVIPFNETIRRCGNNCKLINNNISIQGTGYYDVWASVTVAPAEDGPVTLIMLQDGIAVPGATDTVNVATAGDNVTLQVKAPVRLEWGCPCNKSVITFELSSASALQSASGEVIKL